MKKMKRFDLFLAFALLAVFLVSCTGTGAANSWSGTLLTENYVYYAGSTQVFALRAENGNVAWAYPEKAAANRLFFAEPVLAGEQLLVGDYASTLASLNVADGRENWVFEEAAGRYIDSPLVVNDYIIAPNADYNLYALDLNGAKKWVFKADHAFWARPESDGKTVFAPSLDHKIYALGLETGVLKWEADLSAPLVSRPLLTEDGILYLGNMDGVLYAISSEDGTKIWEQRLGGGVWAQPILHEGSLFVGDQSGRINILDAENGDIIEYIETNAAILGKGAVLTDGIIFGNEDGELTMVGFTGKKLWTRSLDGKMFANLQALGERVIVVATQGEQPLVAIDTNGNEIWYFSGKE